MKTLNDLTRIDYPRQVKQIIINIYNKIKRTPEENDFINWFNDRYFKNGK